MDTPPNEEVDPLQQITIKATPSTDEDIEPKRETDDVSFWFCFCSECHEYFDTKELLETHKSTVHFQDTYDESEDKSGSSKAGEFGRREHSQEPPDAIHSPGKSFNCQICDKFYTSHTLLVSHIKDHMKDKPLNCNYCSQTFAKKTHLKQHERIHTGEKPFSCNICGKSFTQPGHLMYHRRIHTGEKPYKCHACQKAFVKKCDVTRHARVHTGEKPYDCKQCGRFFTFQSNLAAHSRTHTGEKNFQCKYCQKSFAHGSSRVKHEQKWHRKQAVAALKDVP